VSRGNEKIMSKDIKDFYLNIFAWSLVESFIIFFIILNKLVYNIWMFFLCSIFLVDYLYFRHRRNHIYEKESNDISKKEIQIFESGGIQYSNFDHKTYFIYITRRLELIDRFTKNMSGNMLDIGCGAGHSTIPLIKENRNIVGVDISSSSLYILKRRSSSIMLIEADAENLPFKKELFDSIVMGEVLEHLLDPFSALKECYKLLSKGGMLVITTPTAARILPTINPLIWLDQILGIWNRKIIGVRPTVIRHVSGKLYYHTNFTYREIENLLTKVGFKIIYLFSDSPKWIFHGFKLLPREYFTKFVIMVERIFRRFPLLNYLGDTWIVVAGKSSEV